MYMRRLATLLAGLAVALGVRPGPASDTDFMTTPSGAWRRGRKDTYFPPERRNGERECARRRRQMAHVRQRQEALVSRALGARGFQ